MTVSVKRNQVQFGGDGSTTAFTVNFPYTELDQVKVFLDTTEQTRTTHFTLTDPGATGTVTFLSAPASGKLVTIKRETDYLQAIDYVNNDALDAETLEKAFDKLTMMCQQLDVKIEKSIGFEETVSEVDTTSLKLAAGTADLAGKLLAFDSTGAFVTTQEIGTFKGDDSTTTTAAYVVRDLVRDDSNDNVYFTKQDAPIGVELTDTSYFELLVDVATVRTLKTQAETAKTASETAQAASEAALASFEGQFKTGATNPYSGTPDNGDLWYDTANNILKYYVTGTGFEPVTTSLATVTDNYLTISNQVITAGTVPISLGGTGGTSASEARTLLGVSISSDVQAYDVGLQSISGLTTAANKMIYTTASDTYAVTDLTAFARTILDDADAATVQATLSLVPGTDIQAFDADTAKYDDTTANFTGTLQNGGSNVVVDSDIGSTVEAYSATNADYGDTTANFTGTLQNGGSNVVVDSDINSTVQAYDAGLGEIAALAVTDGNFIVGNGTAWVAESGATARTSLGLGSIATQDSNSVSITGGSVTGITDLAIADGGTGASTASVARGNLLPSYSGNGSKVLALNSGGTDVEWVTQSQVFTAGVANAFEHPNSVTDSFTVSASDHRFYVGPVSFTNTVTLAGKMLIFDGLYNTTGTINITGTLHVRS
jgi:hypothetical protein